MWSKAPLPAVTVCGIALTLVQWIVSPTRACTTLGEKEPSLTWTLYVLVCPWVTGPEGGAGWPGEPGWPGEVGEVGGVGGAGGGAVPALLSTTTVPLMPLCRVQMYG